VAVSDFEKGFRPRISRDVSIDYHPSPSCGAACAAAWPMMNRSSPKNKIKIPALRTTQSGAARALLTFKRFKSFLILFCCFWKRENRIPDALHADERPPRQKHEKNNTKPHAVLGPGDRFRGKLEPNKKLIINTGSVFSKEHLLRSTTMFGSSSKFQSHFGCVD
jgi:hypothetical protein